MRPEAYDSLNARITRVERENRRLKGLGVGVLAAAAVAICSGAVGDGSGQLLRGEGLVLSHAGSGSGIVLGANRDGEPEVTLSRVFEGKTYSMSIQMHVAEDGVPVLIFVDQSGTRRFKVPR